MARDIFVETYAFVEMLAPAFSAAAVTISLGVAMKVYGRHSVLDMVALVIGVWFIIASFIGAAEHRKCRNCVLLVVDKSDLPRIYEALKEERGGGE